MTKLFAIYIGGETPGANIEVHDMRFVAAPSILDTYDELLRQWWGKPGSLHVDCWANIDHADGYDVTLRPEPYRGEEKLYYVNLGGYDRAEFRCDYRGQGSRIRTRRGGLGEKGLSEEGRHHAAQGHR